MSHTHNTPLFMFGEMNFNWPDFPLVRRNIEQQQPEEQAAALSRA